MRFRSAAVYIADDRKINPITAVPRAQRGRKSQDEGPRGSGGRVYDQRWHIFSPAKYEMTKMVRKRREKKKRGDEE